MTTIDVDAIRKLSDDLAKATDEMNEGIDQAERALISTRLGVSGTVQLPDAHGTLVFKKTEHGWGLFVDRPGNAGLTPLRKTPRATRIVACTHLHALLEDMLGRAEAGTHEVRAATEGFASFAASTRVDGEDRADVEREETLEPGQIRVDVVVILEGEDAALDGLRVVDDALDAGDLQSAIESLVEDRELELSIVSVVCRWPMSSYKDIYRFKVNGRLIVLHGALVERMAINHEGRRRGTATFEFAFDYMLDETPPPPEPTYDFRVEVEGVDGGTTRSKRGPRRPPESYYVPPFDPNVGSSAPPRPTPRSSAGPVDDWPEDMADPGPVPPEPQGYKGPTDPEDRSFRQRGPEPRGPEPRRRTYGTKGFMDFGEVHFGPRRGFTSFEEFNRAMEELLKGQAGPRPRPAPPPPPPPVGGWATTLENPTTLAAAEANYKRLAKTAHPDHGGSHDAMVALNAAIAVARKHFKR